jgi:AraC-like DNA-binding protein
VVPDNFFSSDQLPAELNDDARFSLWRDIYIDLYGAADMRRWTDRPFAGHSRVALFGDAALLEFKGTLQRYVRTAAHVAADGRDHVMIGINRTESRLQLSQRGREVMLPRGSVSVFMSSEPSATEIEADSSFIGFAVPRVRLVELVPNIDDFAGSVLPPDMAPVRHLVSYIEWLMTSEAQEHAVLARHAETSLIDLMALVLNANGDIAEQASKRGLRSARVQEIIREISLGFVDPAFSAGTIGAKLGLSARYVQELLQETGYGFTDRVLELRLQKARAMLGDPKFDRLKIGEIAFACGFNEASYFNRCFRRRFGEAPMQVRGRV